MERIDLCAGWKFFGPDAPHLAGRVRLPHDFSIGSRRSPDSPMGSEGGWFAGGVGVYERTLELSPLPAKAVLVLEGCMGEAEVALNGEVLARHGCGYTEFHLDLTGRLTGRDTLQIRVDNTVLPVSRWYTGSGLYRPVWLAVGGAVHIPLWSAWVKTTGIAGDEAEVEAVFEVENSGGETACPLSVELLGPDGGRAAQLSWRQALPHGRVRVTRRLALRAPALWSPERPALYTAVFAAGGDRHLLRFGVRQLTVSPEEGLRLNGAPLKLRGGCIHHDNGPLGACAHPRAEARRIARLKAAGYNAVRCAHNPPSTALLDACDRLGMLVMDEAFDGWRRGKTAGDQHRWFDGGWPQELAAMILRDRGHPSVILYSIGNEVAERCEPEGAALCRALAAEARRLDPTRPVCCGVNGVFVEGGKYQGLLSNLLNGEGAVPEDLPPEVREALRRAGAVPQDWGALTEDFIAPLDVAGYNYLDFRYAPDHARFPRRVVCGTESFPKLMAAVWQHTLENPHVIGDFTWAAWDYLGESGIGRAGYGQKPAMFAPYPWHLASCGDYDICGRPRAQSWMRRALWGVEPRPSIWVLPPERAALPETVTAWGWPDLEESWTFPGGEGRTVRVEVYTNAEAAELWLNGACLARQAADGCRAVFWVDYQPGVLRAVNLRGGCPAEEAALETAGEPVRLTLTPEEPALAAGGDLAYLWAEVRDAAGRLVPWAGPEISCTLCGAGGTGEGESRGASAGFGGGADSPAGAGMGETLGRTAGVDAKADGDAAPACEPPRIIACGAGDPQSEHCYTGNVCHAWRGRALFILRSGDAAGPLRLRASAAGLAPGECEVEVLS